MLLGGCYEPRGSTAVPEDDGSRPFLGEFTSLLAQDAGAGGAVNCGPDPSPLSALYFQVRTIPVGGRYAPRNAGAIWIEDADSVWVKTLERWGKRRAKWLDAFNEASGGDTTDAITRATLPRHEVHEVLWDLTDLSGCEVPNGAYRVRIEVTDWSGTGENSAVAFDKGEAPVEASPPDPPYFREITLQLE